MTPEDIEALEALGAMTLAHARRMGLLDSIAVLTERSDRYVSRIFKNTRGNVLVRNAFAKYWPDPDEFVADSDESETDEDDVVEPESSGFGAEFGQMEIGVDDHEVHYDENDVRAYRDNLAEFLREVPDNDVRGSVWPLPAVPPGDAQPLMRHQEETLQRIEANGGQSGILHLPTGSGKTRIALEMMARILADDPRARVIWATHGKTLIRQSMIRLVELLEHFSAPPAVAWVYAKQVETDDIFDLCQVVYTTRDTFTKWLDAAADGRRSNEPLRTALTSRSASMGRRIIVVYDECHELGASKLQKAWRKFNDRVLTNSRLARERFRVFGLSATPMPTSTATHKLLQSVIFPILPGTESAKPWGVLVHKSESMRTLTERRILCPINLGIHNSGRFDVPDELFRAVTGECLPRLPRRGTRSEAQWAHDFSRVFNRDVMSHPDILRFLSDRIGEQLDSLGKTVVFCANINAANQLVAFLKRNKKVGAGKVTLVHSKMEDPEIAEWEEDVDRAAVRKETQIKEFVDRGDDPCVIVNVGMLTTGFDDPKIRTIILARLTFSKNLFWQMIGRGLRGPRAMGTVDCHVIDPIQLTERFEVFNGYRPDLTTGGIPQNDLEAGNAAFMDPNELAPVVEIGVPAPGDDPEMLDIRQDVQEALRSFLRGGKFDVAEMAEILSEDVELEYGPKGPQYQPATGENTKKTVIATLETRVQQLAQQLEADLSWVYGDIPQRLDDLGIQKALRIVQLVEEHNLKTEEDWRRYELARL